MGLANGKIILITEYDSNNEWQTASFLTSCRALLGAPLPTLRKVDAISYEVTNILNNIISDRWKNSNFFVKYLNSEP